MRSGSASRRDESDHPYCLSVPIPSILPAISISILSVRTPLREGINNPMPTTPVIPINLTLRRTPLLFHKHPVAHGERVVERGWVGGLGEVLGVGRCIGGCVGGGWSFRIRGIFFFISLLGFRVGLDCGLWIVDCYGTQLSMGREFGHCG